MHFALTVIQSRKLEISTGKREERDKSSGVAYAGRPYVSNDQKYGIQLKY